MVWVCRLDHAVASPFSHHALGLSRQNSAGWSEWTPHQTSNTVFHIPQQSQGQQTLFSILQPFHVHFMSAIQISRAGTSVSARLQEDWPCCWWPRAKTQQASKPREDRGQVCSITSLSIAPILSISHSLPWGSQGSVQAEALPFGSSLSRQCLSVVPFHH